jgi:alkylation response protein AidB-like acyl-CoA dehydrogenase
MSTDFGEVHDELRAVARDLLGARPGPGSALDWRLAAGSGWLGLEVPESLDGAGATFAEVAVILREMGRAATSGPYLGSVVLGVGALVLVSPGPGRDDLLRRAAAGSTLLALALPGDASVGSSVELPFRVSRSSGRLVVDGEAAFVPDATEADRLLLPALDPDGVPVVVSVDPGATGVDVAPQPVLDATRALARVTAGDVEVAEADLWRFAADPDAAVSRLRDRAAVAVACDSLGLSEAMLEATVAYAGVRQQFGRPIGSFQAVKHACADMLVQVSLARELVAAAVDQVAAADPGAAVAASMAKAYACGTAVDVVGQALQLHGGIGYTWESGIHVYLKRATLDRSLYGSPPAHRRALATRHL